MKGTECRAFEGTHYLFPGVAYRGGWDAGVDV